MYDVKISNLTFSSAWKTKLTFYVAYLPFEIKQMFKFEEPQVSL